MTTKRDVPLERKPAFTDKLVKMWRNGRGCDVTIKCKDTLVAKAHSVVLISVSDKLEELLSESVDDVIISEDIELKIWNSLLECIYTGLCDIDLSYQELNAVIELANLYDITHILSQLQDLKESKFAEMGDELNLECAMDMECTDVISEVIELAGQEGISAEKLETTDGKETVESGECSKCGKNCTAKTVMCLLCFREVSRENAGHMTEEHPFSNNTCKWLFTCETEQGEMALEAEMLFMKRKCIGHTEFSGQTVEASVTGKESESSSLYICMRCNDTFVELNQIKRHVEEMYNVTSNVCSVCDMGFSGNRELLEHEHYCMGGSVHECSTCHQKVGLLAALSEHMLADHDAQPQKLTSEQAGVHDAVDRDESRSNKKAVVIDIISIDDFKQKQLGSSAASDASVATESVTSTPAATTQKDKSVMLFPSVDQRPKQCCLVCRSECTAKKILCLSCFQFVSDKASHKSSVHHYTPLTSYWLYTCDLQFAEFPANVMAFSKHQVHRIPVANNKSLGLQYYCSTCKGRFESMEKLCSHVVGQFKCTLCATMLFTSQDEVREHMENTHGISNVFVCQACSSGFTEERLHKEHEYYCSGGKLRTCGKCQEVSWCEEDWEKHAECTEEAGNMEMDSSPSAPEENRAMETDDGKNALSSSNEKIKIAVIQVVRKESYLKMCMRCGLGCKASEVKCRYCYQTVDTKDKQEHMAEVHPLTPVKSIWPVDCEFQRVKGHHPAVLSAYKFSRSNNEPKEGNSEMVPDTVTVDQVICAICCVNSQSSEELKEHLASVHGIKSPFYCGQCFTFVSPSWPALARDHANLCPGGDLYQCLQCGTLAGSLESANIHWHQVHVTLRGLLSPQEKKEDGNPNSKMDDRNPRGDGKPRRSTRSRNKTAKAKQRQETPKARKRGQPLKPNATTETASPATTVMNLRNHSPRVSATKQRKVAAKEEVSVSTITPGKHMSEMKWRNVCVTCVEKNQACPSVAGSNVLCLYCFEAVPKTGNHMKDFHPFTPAESIWPYSCNTGLLTGNRGKRVFTKEHKHSRENALKHGKFPCNGCLSKFDSINDLLGHMTHQYKCVKCKLCFGKLGMMVRHMETQHSFSEVFVCKVCNSGFRSGQRMALHEYYCDQGQVPQCGQCKGEKKRFWRKEDYTEHLENVHGISQEPEAENLMESACAEPLQTIDTIKTEPELVGTKAKTGASKKISLSDEATQEQLRAYCDLVYIARSESHQKVCLTCSGTSCTAEEVHCGYCGLRVLVSWQLHHFQTYHSRIPASSLWPVKCKGINKVIEPLSKDLYMPTLAPPVQQSPPGVQESDSHDAKLYRACALCVDPVMLVQTPEDLVKHLSEEHDTVGVACKQCGMVLPETCRNFVKDHFHICSGGEVIQCKLCRKLSGSWASAKVHQNKHHTTGNSVKLPITERDTMRCSVGGEEHAKHPQHETEISGNPHMVSKGGHGYEIVCIGCKGHCSKGNRVKCRLCGEVVEKDDIHMKIRHPYSLSKTWFVICSHMDKHFSNYYMGEKLQDQNYRCISCDEIFAESDKLFQHISENHLLWSVHESPIAGRKRRPMLTICPVCEAVIKVTHHKSNYRDHVQFCQHGSLFTCDRCGLELDSDSRMTKHKQVAHSESTSVVRLKVPPGTLLKCEECTYSTFSLSELKGHLKAEHNFNDNQASQLCRVCFKSFRLKSDRERHEQAIHHGGKALLCDHCGKEFEIPSQLRQHMEYHHQGKNVSCVERSRRNRSKKLICPFCGEIFSGGNKLNMHVRKVHEKVPELKCCICSKFFGSKPALQIHENRHFGRRPYQCKHCSYTNYTQSLVNQHAKKAHPLEPSQLPIQEDVIQDTETVEISQIPFDFIITM